SVRVGSYLFGANAGSGTLTSWRLDRDGTSPLSHPVAATTAGGVIDLAAGDEGRFVYALNAVHGTVDVLANDGHGGLTPVSQATGLPVIDADGGPEGILAS
ncbi:MAG TPA: hypothetical protein VFL59_14350, partial [Candidatus Nanopelagicales bacterium]|nr:hypothetical protein [Candidatus Nanopelagicales bacterium]